MARPRSDDVVFLRAGEVEHRGAVVFGFEQAHVHLQIVCRRKLSFVFAVRQNLLDLFVGQNVLRQRFDLAGGVLPGASVTQQIEVADGFLAAAQRTGRSDRANQLADSCEMYSTSLAASLSDESMRNRPLDFLNTSIGFENVLFAFFAEAGQVAQFALRAPVFRRPRRCRRLNVLQSKATFFGPSD